MDPNATLRLIADCPRLNRECTEHIWNLYTWIKRGGFHPNWNDNPKGKKRYQRVLGLGDDLR